jgi:hypothetical protein
MSDLRGAEIMESVLDRGRVVQRGTGQYQPITLNDIVSGMGSKLAKIQEYGNLITQLRKMGYGPNVIDQVLQMGPEQGLEYARALATATPDIVAHINATDTGITNVANTLAAEAGSHMYDAGIAAQQGIVAGLASQQAALYNQAQTIAAAMLAGVQDALDDYRENVRQGQNVGAGIRRGLDSMRDEVGWGARGLAWAIIHNFNEVLQLRSPSKVAIGKGQMFGKGIAIGLMREKRNVEKASRVLAYAVNFDPDATYASSNRRPISQSIGSGGNVYDQKIDITTQELDPRRHAAMLGWELAQRGI